MHVDIIISIHSGEQLSADDLRILNIVLVDHLDKLDGVGLKLSTAAASQTAITKKNVVDCLQQIGQHDLANVLSARQGENLQNLLHQGFIDPDRFY